MSLIAELKRRNVFRVAIAYVVLSWLLLQMGDLLFDLMGLPDWALRIVLGILVLGFIPALIISWVYELTPEGLKKESEVDRTQSITPQTGQRLDLITVVLLLIAIGLFVVDRFGMLPSEENADGVQADSAAAPTPASEPAEDTVEDTSVAALPFANLSGDESALPFTNGLHDDLLTQLARIQDLRVISRTSVLEYRDTTKNMRTIGEELGVSHLIEGGVQRAGDRVRINVQLIDAETDEHLWAETYDRALTVENIFEIQSEIAQRIADELKISLTSRTVNALERPTDNLQAYEAYLRGRMALDSTDYTEQSTAEVRRHLDEAIRLDPEFAQAYAMRALAADLDYWFRGRNTRKREEALEWANRALAIDPDLPEAHFALASIYYHGYLDYDRALSSLSLAEESMTGQAWPLITKGAIYRRSGQGPKDIEIFEQAAAINPRGPGMLADLANSYANHGRFDDARAIAARMEELPTVEYLALATRSWIDWFQSGDSSTYQQLVETFGPFDVDGVVIEMPELISALWAGDRVDLIQQLIDGMEAEGHVSEMPFSIIRVRYGLFSSPEEQASALQSTLQELQARVLGGDQDPYLRLHIAETLIQLKRGEEAKALLVNLLEDPIVARDANEGTKWIREAAFLFQLLGETDSVLDAFEYILSSLDIYSLRSLMGYPGMKELEDHPRFQSLIDQYGWTREDRSEGIAL